jgi:hypothetical protein
MTSLEIKSKRNLNWSKLVEDQPWHKNFKVKQNCQVTNLDIKFKIESKLLNV